MRQEMQEQNTLFPPTKKPILKQKQGKGKSSPDKKKKELRFEIAYDERGIERQQKMDKDKRNRSRGRQSPGQKDSQQQAGAKGGKYEGPSTVKGRRLQLEQQAKEKEDIDKLETKLANEKHTVKSFYELGE